MFRSLFISLDAWPSRSRRTSMTASDECGSAVVFLSHAVWSAGLTVTVVGPGTHSQGGQPSSPTAQRQLMATGSVSLCVTQSWRGLSLMNQHHNPTAWLPDAVVDALVVFGTCVIRLALSRRLKWEEKGNCVFSEGVVMELLHAFKLVVLNNVILRFWAEMFLASGQSHEISWTCR